MSYVNLISRHPAFSWIALCAAFSVPVIVCARLGNLWLGVGVGTIAAGILLVAHKRWGSAFDIARK